MWDNVCVRGGGWGARAPKRLLRAIFRTRAHMSARRASLYYIAPRNIIFERIPFHSRGVALRAASDNIHCMFTASDVACARRRAPRSAVGFHGLYIDVILILYRCYVVIISLCMDFTSSVYKAHIGFGWLYINAMSIYLRRL